MSLERTDPSFRNASNQSDVNITSNQSHTIISTPQEYLTWYFIGAGIFMICLWVIVGFVLIGLSCRNRRRVRKYGVQESNCDDDVHASDTFCRYWLFMVFLSFLVGLIVFMSIWLNCEAFNCSGPSMMIMK